MQSPAEQSPFALPQDIFGAVHDYWRNCCMAAAAELNLAGQLAGGPLHIDVLAERTQTHGPSLYRVLRALESVGIFVQVSPRVFGNTPTSERLSRQGACAEWDWVRGHSSLESSPFDGFQGLMKALGNGKPGFDQLSGMSSWQYLRANPEQSERFNSVLRDLSATITPAVTAALDWSQFPVIADIGGGMGTQLLDILGAYPGCRGILFDQPHVICEAQGHDRMERLGGDFFAGIPMVADACLLRWVLHDWCDEDAVTILKNVRRAGSRLMVVESVIPETAELSMGKWMDITMLVQVGGRERTAAEFRELFDAGGFALERIVPTSSPLSVLICSALS